MSVTIRPATATDADHIVGLMRDAFDESLDSRAPGLLQALSAGGTYIAIEEASALGFVHNFSTIAQSGAWRDELDLLAVASHARGRGIGRLLVAKSVSEARRLGLDLVRALVAADNVPMQGLCRVCGFQSVRRRLSALYVRPPKPVTGAEHPRESAPTSLKCGRSTTAACGWKGEIDQTVI